jgi:small-conductance mechanosensitive channel
MHTFAAMKNLESVFESVKDYLFAHSKYFIAIAAILLIAIVLTRLGRILMARILRKDGEFDPAEKTRIRFFKNAISVIVWAGAFWMVIYTIPTLRAVAITAFAGAGILVVILGLAAQSTFANIISGILIVISRPFRVGDLIKVGNNYNGFVDDITLRHTVILDFQNRRIIIPNSIMGNETILNSTIGDKKICEYVEMGISYDSNADLAMQIMREEAMKHPNYIDNRSALDIANKEPSVIVRIIGFGDSSVNLRAYVWVEDAVKAFQLRYDIYKSIKDRFDKEGIEIPFPYRTLVFKKDSDASKFKEEPTDKS